MINVVLPEFLMLALRWVLLLGPICLVVAMIRARNLSVRAQIGGLFGFLYGLPLIFITHSIAIHLGWWRYGWDALMLNGIPADIVIGGAVLFGPGLYFAFPNTRPLMMCLPIILGLHGTIFSSLEPLVYAGPFWFLGVLFVFLLAHLPAIYLAKWTEENTHLPLRCALLAIMTGGMIFAILPSSIMQAMGGTWDLLGKPAWAVGLTLGLLAITSLIGVSANQTLCLQGQGTPIPLDPTNRLVTTGIYAYLSNPMQLSAVLGWLVLGAFLQNVWVMAASSMAWVFVQGMVRWHHRHDLLKRFPDGWLEYRANVAEWVPRWKPWSKTSATLSLSARSSFHRWSALRLDAISGLDIEWCSDPRARYEHPENVYGFEGSSAIAAAFQHKNFAFALLGGAWLILAAPLASLTGKMDRRPR